MTNRSVISVHTKPEVSKRLNELAVLTRRSRSFLANEAIERYLEEEEAFIKSVLQGKADLDAGRTYTTDEMRVKLEQSISQKGSSNK